MLSAQRILVSLRELDRAGTVCDRFLRGTEFKTAVDLYAFDKVLRLQVTDVIERIKIAIRTPIARQLGKYNPWAHRNPLLLDGKFTRVFAGNATSKHESWLARLDDRAAESKEEFAAHFREK